MPTAAAATRSGAAGADASSGAAAAAPAASAPTGGGGPPARSAASTPVASNTTSASGASSAAPACAAASVTAPPALLLAAARQQPDPRSWESLAEFLFGPDWLSIQLPGDDLEPKLVKEYEEQLKAEGKYVPPQRSSSIAVASGAAASSSASASATGRPTTGSTDTVSSILAEAAQLAAKSASRSATPTPAAAAAGAASGPDAAGTAASGKAGEAAAAAEGDKAGDRKAAAAQQQTLAPAPRKGKQLPATALMPANGPATPGGTANAVNVNTPGSIGKTAGPGGKALTPSGGGGGAAAAAGAAAASGGKAGDGTPGKKDGETPPGTVATSQGVNTSAGLGGKVVPQDAKTSTAARGSDGQEDEDKVVPTASVGWDAPFPEEIPPYPLLASHSHRVDGRDTSKGPANPHKLPFGVPLGLHLAHLVGAEEACRIDYGPNGPRKHLHKVGKSMATLKAEREEERKRRKAERAAGNSAADKHTAELLDAAHKLAQEHAAARAKAKAEDQLKEVPEAYFSAATLGSSYWGSVSAASASAATSTAGDAAKMSSDDKMDIDTADPKVAAAATAEGADKEAAAGRKRARFEDEGEGSSAAKRARTEFGAVPATPQTTATTNAAGQGSKSPTSAAAATAASQRRRPGYVPQFLPPFPPARTYLGGADGSGNAEQAVAELLRSGGTAGGSGASSAAGASASASATRGGGAALTLDSDEVGRSQRVRKSLVGLGSTRSAVSSAPWGAPVTTAGGSVTAPAVLDHVSVPAGRRPGPPGSGPSAGGGSSGKKSPTASGIAAGIQPLSRASNARVSKVLEGSLDAN